MMLGKLLFPGRPPNSDYSGARAIALAVGAVGFFLHFFSSLSFLFSLSLSLSQK